MCKETVLMCEIKKLLAKYETAKAKLAELEKAIEGLQITLRILEGEGIWADDESEADGSEAESPDEQA